MVNGKSRKFCDDFPSLSKANVAQSQLQSDGLAHVLYFSCAKPNVNCNAMRQIIIFFFLAITSCNQIQDFKNDIKVDLSGRHLNTVPDSVFVMTDLTYIDLGSSNVTFFPPLSALVDTNANNITYLPKEIEKLTNLKTLILNSNKLESLPNSITKLTKLEHLDLSLNKNLDIVKELDKLKKLPNLKILEIVGVEPMNKDIVEIIKKELPDTKVVVSLKEYIGNK